MSKIFVLRTNSLLSSADSTLRFGEDNEVVIPLAVLDRLENYNGKPEKKKIASIILSYLESFDSEELFNKGVRQKNGSILRIAKNFSSQVVDMEGITDFDKRVFQVCLGLQKVNESNGRKVILISKSPVIRIKAKCLGILAEDFKDDLFPTPSHQYKGRIHIKTTFDALHNQFYKTNKLSITEVIDYSEIDWVTNMFVEISTVDSNEKCLGRFDGEKIVPLTKWQSRPYGINPKNHGQEMLLECLLHDWEEAPLVIAKGGAGTGKTYCSLAAALAGYYDNKYTRILVATPSETVGNEHLGFLPGDIRDKFSPYLGGIKDNLSILTNGKTDNNKSQSRYRETGEHFFEDGTIEVQPIGFLRGRTIVNTFFIIDETQNIDPGDIKSIVTRAAEGSKFVFLGDPTQVDNPKLNERYNGLVYLAEKLKNNPLCWQVSLESEESVRSELSTVASVIL